VAEHLPDGDAGVLGLGQQGVDVVVQAELALVAQRHDRHRGEGLAVRGDQVLRIGGRRTGSARGGGLVQIGRADPFGPGQRTVTGDGPDESGDTPLGLAFGDDAAECGLGLSGDLGHQPTLRHFAVRWM
jgi:hypothetical protein